ncbi:MAG: BtrH N-terminal domain-containing protein [Acidimicrobiia bacterium]|nr:BtrH N-terminal domain-containing protein [Acidimicrobiia bacterium]
MTRIRGFKPFAGHHCETTTTGNLMRHAGLELSEPMLVGVGESLAFGVLVFKGAPCIGGRPKPEEITQNLAKHLGFEGRIPHDPFEEQVSSFSVPCLISGHWASRFGAGTENQSASCLTMSGSRRSRSFNSEGRILRSQLLV